MTTEPPAGVVRHLHRAALLADPDDLTDGQLLTRFRTGREEAAFALLVRRHGPMVLSVCRRVLGNSHDADDAFQATFLVLVRRAGDLTGRGTVGNWLYGVAYHTALKARAQAMKRRTKEAAAARPEVAPGGPPDWAGVLDAELARLPDKYREPLVLCELEGRSRKEVAARLGVPEGTVSSRLATAKKRLAERLPKELLGLAAAVPVPAGLSAATVRSAAALAAGATGAVPAAPLELSREVSAMVTLSKLKMAAVGVAVAVGLAAVVAGRGSVAAAPRRAEDPPAANKPAPAAKPPAPEPAWKKEFRKVYGLADGEVLKRVPHPPADCREKHYREEFPDNKHGGSAGRPLLFRDDGRGPKVWGLNGGGYSVGDLLWTGLGIPPQEVEGDKDLVDAKAPGDWVVRPSAPAEKLVPRLEAILRDECGLKVTLTFREAEREVVVARGRFESKPLDGKRKNHVDVYAKQPTDRNSASGGSGTLSEFLVHLGAFVGRRVVDEVEAAPKGEVSFTTYARSPFTEQQAAEDRDPAAVLENVSAQTGLTFATEKRKVRVLVVEEAKK